MVAEIPCVLGVTLFKQRNRRHPSATGRIQWTGTISFPPAQKQQQAEMESGLLRICGLFWVLAIQQVARAGLLIRIAACQKIVDMHHVAVFRLFRGVDMQDQILQELTRCSREVRFIAFHWHDRFSNDQGVTGVPPSGGPV